MVARRLESQTVDDRVGTVVPCVAVAGSFPGRRVQMLAGLAQVNADLDACHGRTWKVVWNGTEQVVHHCDVTLEYPCTVGCYHGAPSAVFAEPRG